MANFVVIKGMDYYKKESINDALETIKRKIVRKNIKDVVTDFTTWYSNMMVTILAHDLYEIVGTKQSYLEEQLLFVERFEATFAQKFTTIYTRKSISKIKNKFKRSCIVVHDHDLYFGTMANIADIYNIFTLFKEYAEFVVNLYKDIIDKIDTHLSKEGKELNDFIELTKIKGKVNYQPMIGDIQLQRIPFVIEYTNCKEALEAINIWFSLQLNETNIIIDEPTDDRVDTDLGPH